MKRAKPKQHYRIITTKKGRKRILINKGIKGKPKKRLNFGMGFFQDGELIDFPEDRVLNISVKEKPKKLRLYEGMKGSRKPFDITVNKDSDVTIRPTKRPASKLEKNIVNLDNVPIATELREGVISKWKVPKSHLAIYSYDKDTTDSGNFHEVAIKPKGDIEVAPHKLSQTNLWYGTVSSMKKMHKDKDLDVHNKEWKKWRKSKGYKD